MKGDLTFPSPLAVEGGSRVSGGRVRGCRAMRSEREIHMTPLKLPSRVSSPFGQTPHPALRATLSRKGRGVVRKSVQTKESETVR